MLSRVVRPVARNVVARQYHAPGSYKPVTMNDMPVPQGSWKLHYDNLQRRYNAQMAGGIGFALFTLFVAKSSGLFYFNWGPELKNK